MPNLIEQAIERGDPDELIVQRIMEETAVVEVDAWQILARTKGEDVTDTPDG